MSNEVKTQGFELYVIDDVSVLPAPVQTAAAMAGTGGTVAAGTYYAKITAVNAQGETIGSNEQSITTTGSTSTITWNWGVVAGATSHRIYVGTAAGAESSYFTVAAVGTYTQTTTAGTAGTVPTTNTATLSPALRKIANVTDIGEFGAQSNDIDTTNLDSTGKEYIQGLPDFGNAQIKVNLKKGDIGHKLLSKLASAGGDTRKKWAILGSGGVSVPAVSAGAYDFSAVTDRDYWSFTAGVKSFRFPVSLDQIVKATVDLKISGSVTTSLNA